MRAPSYLRLALFATVLGLLLVACGGGSTTVIETVTSGGTTTSPEPEPPSEETTQAETEPDTGELKSFQSPSGNIGCVVGPDGARCDIQQREWDPPQRPADCPEQVDYGQGLEVGQSGPGHLVCAGDTALNPEAPKLSYGNSVHVGDFSCTSSEAGVDCRDDGDGRGFFISKQSYRLY